MNKTADRPVRPVQIELRDPAWAALLGWLWPGAGHLYQRRYAKGVLFMVCILSTYFYGLALGDGHVVYASWRPNDYRWQYFCQLGTGLPALPAAIQAIKVSKQGEPFFITRVFDPGDFPAMREMGYDQPLQEGLMAPPPGPVFPDHADVLAFWHGELQHKFEIATLFTVIAGLLNLLAVYDAFAGPALLYDEEEDEKAKSASKTNEDQADGEKQQSAQKAS